MFGRNRYLVVVAAALVLSACSTPPQIINDIPAGKFNSDGKVGVIWLSRCSNSVGCKKSTAGATLAEFTPIGSVGLLVYGAVMSAHEDVIAALDDADATDLIQSRFLLPAEQLLEARGMQPEVVMDPYYPGNLDETKRHKVVEVSTFKKVNVERESHLANPFVYENSYDLNVVANTMDADFLLVLELLNFEVHREFLSLGIPFSEPYAVGAVRVHLLDVENDELLLNDYAYHQVHVVDGEWKQPGNWENLLGATNGSLENALNEVMSRLSDSLQ